MKAVVFWSRSMERALIVVLASVLVLASCISPFAQGGGNGRSVGPGAEVA